MPFKKWDNHIFGEYEYMHHKYHTQPPTPLSLLQHSLYTNLLFEKSLCFPYIFNVYSMLYPHSPLWDYLTNMTHGSWREQLKYAISSCKYFFKCISMKIFCIIGTCHLRSLNLDEVFLEEEGTNQVIHVVGNLPDLAQLNLSFTKLHALVGENIANSFL